ncbi:Panacea domain-containing protein [Filimonas effusa]|uniref:DUF4065 domain-containing protein n=1 Tax=Filimonas effusa TaxID=2508721 RepID=A0A4Q1DAI0_9BACT|nr:type II toxin-antitoxin system antitoxin SocA domain-containing protein [Filimonas effusa]RXK86250.1 DUF4065 domain-containing protein [Filimonas effusa]
MENPLAIANFFVNKSFETGKELTPMKLVKLTYIAHGWHLGLTGKPLLSEPVEAWKYGPVVVSVYREFKKFGNGQIKTFAEAPFTDNIPMPSDNDMYPFLNKIWDVYSKYDGLQLSALTHQKGTPWDTTWNEMGGCNREGVIIPNDLIQKHYKIKANASQQPAQSTV